MKKYLASVQERLRKAEIERAAAEARAVAERRRRRAVLALAAAVVFVIVLGGVGWWYIASDRASRRAETERNIASALSKAEQLQAQAMAIQPTDAAQANAALNIWKQALLAVEQADAAMSAGLAHDATGPRVAAIRRDLTTKLDEARRHIDEIELDSVLARDIEAARFLKSRSFEGKEEAWDKAGEAYQAAFQRRFGVDLLTTEPQESKALFQHFSSETLTAAVLGLDLWSLVVEGQPNRPRELADLLDSDPWRRGFRELASRGSREQIEQLAVEAQQQNLPAISVVLVAELLQSRGLHELNLQFLREQQPRFSDDFWVNTAMAYSPSLSNKESVPYARAAVACQPRNGRARALLANLLLYVAREEGDPPEILDAACREAAMAVEVEPDFAYGLAVYSEALRRTGRFEEGLQMARRTMEMLQASNSEYAPAYSLVVRTLHQGGDFELAFEAARRTSEQGGSMAWLSGYHRYLADRYMQQGDLGHALYHSRRGLTLDPKVAGNYYNAAFLLRAHGDFDAALDMIKQAAALLPPREEEKRVGYRGLNLADGSVAFADVTDKQVHVDLAWLLYEAGDLPATIAAANETEQFKAGKSETHQAILGMALVREGKSEEGLEACQRAIAIDASDEWNHIFAARAFYEHGDYQRSFDEARQAMRFGPRNPTAHLLAGLAQARLGDFEASVDPLRTALRENRLIDTAGAVFDRGRTPLMPLEAASCFVSLGRQPEPDLPAKRRVWLFQQANSWLTADLADWRRRLESGNSDCRSGAYQVLLRWFKDDQLAATRDPAVVAFLPAEDQAVWQNLWREAAALQRQANAIRRVAEGVLDRGGVLGIVTQAAPRNISKREELPAEPVVLSLVSLSNMEALPGFVEDIAALDYLDSLSLVNLKINDASLGRIAGLPLRSLVLQRNDITGECFPELFRGRTDLLELALSNNPLNEAALIHLRQLNRVRSLNVSGATGDLALAEITKLRSLRSLYTGNACTVQGLESLRGLSSLRNLTIGSSGIDDQAITTLSSLKSLRLLQVSSTKLSDAGARRLQEAMPQAVVYHPALEPSEESRMAVQWAMEQGGVVYGFEGDVTRQYSAPPQSRFAVIAVNFVSQGPLTGAVNLRALRSLESLHWPKLQGADGEVEHLVTLDGLNLLSLNQSDLGDEGLRRLGALRELERLYLGSTLITSNGLKHLSAFKHLWHLGLSGTAIDDAGLEHLGRLDSLQNLDLNRCKNITSAGLKHLTPLPILRVLSAQYTAIDDAAVAHLKQMTGLRILQLQGTKITENGIDQLRTALPHCAIFSDGGTIVPLTKRANAP